MVALVLIVGLSVLGAIAAAVWAMRLSLRADASRSLLLGESTEAKAVLSKGRAGRAKVIKAEVIARSQSGVGDLYVRATLEVEDGGQPTYEVQYDEIGIKPLETAMFQLGNTLPVKIDRADPQKLVIDRERLLRGPSA